MHASTSNNYSCDSRGWDGIVKCHTHQRTAALCISKTPSNEGRKFWKCSIDDGDLKCNFFRESFSAYLFCAKYNIPESYIHIEWAETGSVVPGPPLTDVSAMTTPASSPSKTRPKPTPQTPEQRQKRLRAVQAALEAVGKDATPPLPTPASTPGPHSLPRPPSPGPFYSQPSSPSPKRSRMDEVNVSSPFNSTQTKPYSIIGEESVLKRLIDLEKDHAELKKQSAFTESELVRTKEKIERLKVRGVTQSDRLRRVEAELLDMKERFAIWDTVD